MAAFSQTTHRRGPLSVQLPYFHLDVFSNHSFGGNPLPVVMHAGALSSRQMLAITQELRCFEAAFVTDVNGPRAHVRVFDLIEELPFAGHPLVGAAALLHRLSAATDSGTWELILPDRTVEVSTVSCGNAVTATLKQGSATFLGEVQFRDLVAEAFSLTTADLHAHLPLEVVDTGLRYLIVPVLPQALARARVAFDLTDLLLAAGAQFAVLFDESELEIRHWNNDGVLEDVATGSAAGTIGAYRLKHKLARSGESFALNQGRFVHRASVIRVEASGDGALVNAVNVGGQVSFVAHGSFEVLP